MPVSWNALHREAALGPEMNLMLEPEGKASPNLGAAWLGLWPESLNSLNLLPGLETGNITIH